MDPGAWTQGRGLGAVTIEDREAVRQQCVFTTHTPVPAGHDKFPGFLTREVLGQEWADTLEGQQCCIDGTLNMTYLGMIFSRYINGVSMRHDEIASSMLPSYPINSITNGVHAVTWTTPAFQDLYDRHFPEWRHHNLYLRYAVGIPLEEIQQAHNEAKRELLAEVERRTGVRLDPGVMTIGFARRVTAYKRTDLLFSDSAGRRAGRPVRQAGAGAPPPLLRIAKPVHCCEARGHRLERSFFNAQRMVRQYLEHAYEGL